MKLSLQTKAALFIALVIGITSIISTSLIISAQARGIENSLTERGKAFIYTFAKIAEEGILSENLNLLHKAAFIEEPEDIELIQVYATTWDAIDAHPFEKLEDRPLPEAKKHFMGSDAIFSMRLNGNFEFYSKVTYSSFSGNPAITLGFVRIVMSTDSLQKAIRKTILIIIAIAVCLTLLSIVIVNFVIRRFVVNPVAELEHSMTRFKNGQSLGDLQVVSDDEVGRLSESFNAMRRALQEKDSILRDSERHVTLLLNSIAEGIYGVDLNGNCIFVNPAALRMLGYDHVEDLVGKKIHNMIHHTRPDGTPYPAGECKIYRCYHTGEGCNINDEMFWRSDGTSFPIEYWAQPIMHEGVPIGGVAAFVDITERRKTEEEIRAKERELVAIFEHVPLIMMLVNGNNKVRRVNQQATDFAGLSMEEIIGRRMGETLHCHHAHDVPEGCGAGPHCKNCELRRTIMQTLETGESHSQRELRHRLSISGMNVEAVFVVSTIRLNVGQEPMALICIQDITEQRKLEEQLRQAQKMESIGTLAGGIAHDFNNILTAIIGYGNIALMKMAKDDPQRLNIEQMLEAGERAAQLTKGLLLFSRKQSSERNPVDLNNVVIALEKLLNRIIGEDIVCTKALSGIEIAVLADAQQLEQVLMNLAVNARDAMPKGGEFTIAVEKVRLDDEFITAHGYGKPGWYALMTVSDTGCGMDEATRLRIFEPFFTTKEVGKGTGLGLAVVYGIIKQHEGFVNVYSEPGIGTTFRLYLPLIETGVIDEKKRLEFQYSRGGTETILLAEDNEVVRALGKTVLEEVGYTVITAIDGDDAVNKFKENRDIINLALLDVIMPKKSGREVCDEIRRMNPDVKVLFSSGYTADIMGKHDILMDGADFISKPATPSALLGKIREMLDGQKADDDG